MENQTEQIVTTSSESSVTDNKKEILKMEEPNMAWGQKIILCLMSAGLLFGAASLHEAVPLIGFFAYFIYPIVVANLTYRYGYVMSLGTMIIAHCLVGAFWSPYVARPATLSVGVIGLLFGFCFRRGYSGKRTFFTVAGIYVVSVLLLQQFISAGGFLGAIAEEAYLQTVFARGLVNALRYDVAQLILEMPGQFADEFGSVLFFLFGSMVPAIFICQQAVLIWLYYLAVGFAMKEMKHDVATMPALSSWRVPRWMFWSVLAVAVIDGFIQGGASWFSIACVNILLCAALFFMVCGIGVFWHYVRFSQVSWYLKVVAVVVVVYFLRYSLSTAMIVGALDAIFDFRKLKKSPQPIVDTGAEALEWERQQMAKNSEYAELKTEAETEIEETDDAESSGNADTDSDKDSDIREEN